MQVTTREVTTKDVTSRDVVVVGASAGGVEALRAFAAGLPEDFSAAVLVVLHQRSGGTSALPRILARAGPLPALTAQSGMPLQPGHLQVAPPDHHLLVADDHLLLSRGPTENGHRPAVNALFRSAAKALGPRVVGIVLSGVLDDGAAGMVTIASQGGMTLVQDPEEALYPGMPRSVLRLLQPDFVLPAAQMGKVVAEQIDESVDLHNGSTLTTLELLETALAERGDVGVEHEMGELGNQAGLSCPDCQGALVELTDRGTRYRCRVGHGWTADALLEAQSENLERALWAALRMLEERASLAERLQEDSRAKHSGVEEVYSATAAEMAQSAASLRSFLLSGLPPGAQAPQDESS